LQNCLITRHVLVMYFFYYTKLQIGNEKMLKFTFLVSFLRK